MTSGGRAPKHVTASRRSLHLHCYSIQPFSPRLPRPPRRRLRRTHPLVPLQDPNRRHGRGWEPGDLPPGSSVPRGSRVLALGRRLWVEERSAGSLRRLRPLGMSLGLDRCVSSERFVPFDRVVGRWRRKWVHGLSSSCRSVPGRLVNGLNAIIRSPQPLPESGLGLARSKRILAGACDSVTPGPGAFVAIAVADTNPAHGSYLVAENLTDRLRGGLRMARSPCPGRNRGQRSGCRSAQWISGRQG